MNNALEQSREEEISAEMAQEEEQALRMQLYMLLAQMLRAEPDESLLNQLRQIEAQPDDASPMVKAWAELRMAADMAKTDELADEYHQLFIGIGRGELVPFASWYLTGFLMEKPLAKLRQDLQILGYEREDSVHEPEDHAAALFEVMAMMLQEGIGYDQQKDFFQQHIGSWIGRFMEDLMVADAARFYRSVGQLGKQFMDIEEAYFSMMT
ncbi:MAG: molecular chaperone TorD family protein [Gammaproteobacteria bacterium]|nr:molecular chaperone TorD family protein [Gammaproteobacteria bacterium]